MNPRDPRVDPRVVTLAIGLVAGLIIGATVTVFGGASLLEGAYVGTATLFVVAMGIGFFRDH